MSGSCSALLSSLAACSSAAAELGLPDVTAVDDAGDGGGDDDYSHSSENVDEPPGCYLLHGSLKYNAGRGNTGVCSSSAQCICGGCAGCVPGRFADQQGQSACKGSACPLGRAGPLASTNPSTATCTACEAHGERGGALLRWLRGRGCVQGVPAGPVVGGRHGGGGTLLLSGGQLPRACDAADVGLVQHATGQLRSVSGRGGGAGAVWRRRHGRWYQLG